MKKLFLAFTALTSLFGVYAHACPDVSGTYKVVFEDSDYRKDYTTQISQDGCNSVSFSNWVITYRNGTVVRPNDPPRTEITDGVLRADHGLPASYTWTAKGLEVLVKNINSEHCDDRSLLSKDSSGTITWTGQMECH